MRIPLPVALAALLLLAGAACYSVFAAHVLDRGDAVVHETWSSGTARLPLLLAGAGIAAAAASGVLGTAALRGARRQPLAGLGLPLAAAGAVGLLAFEAGPGAFAAAATVAACFVAAAVAAASFGRPEGGPAWRVALAAAWPAAGTLLALAALGFGALGVLERQMPFIPWSALLAAIALATLLRALARHVARTGQDPTAAALPHQQVRAGLDTEGIRAVAGRLHPFIEEGRGGAAYDSLVAELAQRTGGSVPQRAPDPPAPRLPPPDAALAALLRATAFAAPPALLLPGLWAAAVPLALLGLLLPAAGAALLPRREALPAPWWWAATLPASSGAALCAWLVANSAVAAATAGSAVAVAGSALALRSRRRVHAPPEGLAFLRARKARALAARRTVQAAQGALVAGSFLALPAVLALSPLLIGVELPRVPLRLVAAGALGGAAWAAGALLAGAAARRSLAILDGASAQQEQARRAAHRTFLETLEAT